MSWFRYCVNMVQSNQHRNSVILVNLQQGSQEQKWESNPVETAFHPLFESTGSSSSSLGRFLHYLPQKSLTALGIYLILSVLNPTLLLFLSIPKSSALIFEGTQARVLRCVLVCIGNPRSSLIKRMEWDTQILLEIHPEWTTRCYWIFMQHECSFSGKIQDWSNENVDHQSDWAKREGARVAWQYARTHQRCAEV